MENYPLTEKDVELIQTYCTITRDELTKKVLAISAYLRDNPSTGDKTTKAFDALNNASMFLNAAVAHTEYALIHMEEAYESGKKASDSTKDCGCSESEGCELPNV